MAIERGDSPIPLSPKSCTSCNLFSQNMAASLWMLYYRDFQTARTLGLSTQFS
jgi:hypothetical protein